MAPWAFFLTLFLFLQTIVAIFAMKYFATTRQARARVLTEDAYRALAEKAVTGQSESAAALLDIRARLQAIETLLKEVG